jgi:hypothetical protein
MHEEFSGVWIMAYTTIDDPSAYFHTQLYTGDGSSNNAITNDANSGDFKPDWLWIKSRSYVDLHNVFDSSRGRDKRIFPNLTNAEGDSSPDNFLKSFDTDGFTTGNDAGMNTNSGTLVAWQWAANGGTTASNTDGSITSTVQANTTAGFSVVTYTGNATAGATIGHGLGAVPKWIIVKDRDAAKNWVNYHQSIGNDRSIALNTTDAQTASTDHWHNTTPTSSVFYLGDYSHVNANSDKYVAYCFAEKQGYSKFGSYTGNGNADGPFIYTGFKPAWFMLKATDDSSGRNWIIHNSKMAPTNVAENELIANLTDAEVDNSRLDILSNGIKLRSTSLASNKVNINYIYMAFAESPFVSSEGVPTTAR